MRDQHPIRCRASSGSPCLRPPSRLRDSAVDAQGRGSTTTTRSRASRRPRTRRGAADGTSACSTTSATTCSSRRGKPPSNTRAQNVNTIDEVPDSSWFTNRDRRAPLLGRRARARARSSGRRRTPRRWTLIREKASGFAPGFTARTPTARRGSCRSIRPRNPEGRDGGDRRSRPSIFWALGYNQVETFLTQIDPTRIEIDPKATVRRPSASARRSRATTSTTCSSARRATPTAPTEPRPAGCCRARSSARFRYEGTRPDDPNDIVPHEHRRELRALRVFGAWTNLTDMKAGNTLDTLVTENGRGVVKHYLQDVGSTFGIGANGPHDWDEGWEYFYQGNTHAAAAVHVRLRPEPVADRRLHGLRLDRPVRRRRVRPATWKPHAPTTAYMEMRADDAFWAARRVMAFTDEMIRAIVKTGTVQRTRRRAAPGRRADQAARQDRARLPHRRSTRSSSRRSTAAGVLTFGNAAVQYAVRRRAPESYTAKWSSFDNATAATSAASARRRAARRASRRRRVCRRRRARSCASRSAPTSAAHPSWAQPVVALLPPRWRRLEAGRPRTRLPESRRPRRRRPSRRDVVDRSDSGAGEAWATRLLSPDRRRPSRTRSRACC